MALRRTLWWEVQMDNGTGEIRRRRCRPTCGVLDQRFERKSAGVGDDRRRGV